MSARFKDRLTAEAFRKMPAEQQMSLLNSRLYYFFQKNANQQSLRANEKMIVSDFFFHHYITEARNTLRVEEFLDFSDYERKPDIIDDWLIQCMAGKFVDFRDDEYQDYHSELTYEITRVIERLALPYGWMDYIKAYIALNQLPTLTDIERDTLITVESIDEESIVVRMEKGLKSNDYASAWKALKPFFAQPSIYRPYSDTTENRIYLDREAGLGVSDIAKKYFASQYKTDPIAARDRVKKLLKRFE